MGKYFGTDGVRGVAGADLTCEMAMLIGRGAAAVLTSSTGHKPRILIGKDTRQSGDMLEAALTAGLCSVGADVESLGVVPTPAVAYLVRKYNASVYFCATGRSVLSPVSSYKYHTLPGKKPLLQSEKPQ